MNDPEEFWDPDRIPGWAKEHNWGYGPDDVTKEALYAEVDEVLARHPRLNVSFAHFYFLSADLPRAARFMDEHPSVRFDLAPGIEMLYNISRDPDAGREFFIDYADRIVFGTDLSSGQTPGGGARARGHRLPLAGGRRGVPRAARGRLPARPAGGRRHPRHVPAGRRAGRPSTGATSSRWPGARPVALNAGAAIEECERMAGIAEAMSGTPAAETEAARVAGLLGE